MGLDRHRRRRRDDPRSSRAGQRRRDRPRRPGRRSIDVADTVTEMRKIKHAYDAGHRRQEGHRLLARHRHCGKCGTPHRCSHAPRSARSRRRTARRPRSPPARRARWDDEHPPLPGREVPAAVLTPERVPRAPRPARFVHRPVPPPGRRTASAAWFSVALRTSGISRIVLLGSAFGLPG